jgi:hypothetical protein
MAPADLFGCHASLLLSQDRDDLFLGKFTLPHRLSP